MAHDPNPFIASDQYGAELKNKKDAEKKAAAQAQEASKDALNVQKQHEEDKSRGMI